MWQETRDAGERTGATIERCRARGLDHADADILFDKLAGASRIPGRAKSYFSYRTNDLIGKYFELVEEIRTR